MKISAPELIELAKKILVAAGAAPADAGLVAANLVESNLVGHDSHGVMRIPRYVKAIGSGDIDVTTRPTTVKDGTVTTVIDAGWGFGQVAAITAMERTIEKALAHGVACASVFNCNDVGRLGAYTIGAVEHNCIGILTNNDGGSNPYVAPWGGAQAVLSTNPLSISAPAGEHPPICVDMSTSVTAGSQVQLAIQREEQLPEGCLIDAEGRPTTDPKVLFTDPKGALLPLGSPVAGHKGFALSLGIDILGGALSGAGCSGSAGRDAQGLFAQVIDISAFTSNDAYIAQVTGLIERLKATPVAECAKEIRIPGEHSAATKSERLTGGIYIEDATWQGIIDVGGELGVA
ncbi:MAG TPA: dehydrogenase [Lentisphaeria bacterium]|nr:dehydrogenase [Lentisphaeria bacterium]